MVLRDQRNAARAGIQDQPRHACGGRHAYKSAQTPRGTLAGNTEGQLFHRLRSPGETCTSLDGQSSRFLIQCDRFAVERVEREQPIGVLVSRELIAEIDLANVDWRQGHLAGCDLYVVAMRAITPLAEHVVARVSSPELTIDTLGKLIRQQGNPAAGVQEEVAGLALHNDVHLPQRLAEALEFDYLRLLGFTGGGHRQSQQGNDRENVG